MLRDANGDQFFGFCGTRVYVPDDDPHAEGIAEGVLRRFRERLREELAKEPPADSLTANAGGNATERSEGRVDHNVGRLTPGEE